MLFVTVFLVVADASIFSLRICDVIVNGCRMHVFFVGVHCGIKMFIFRDFMLIVLMLIAKLLTFLFLLERIDISHLMCDNFLNSFHV